MIWGLFGVRSHFVQNARSRFAFDLVPSVGLSQRRVTAFSPFMFFTAALVGLDALLRPAGQVGLDPLMAVALVSAGLGCLAAAWPGPFLPAWMRDVEARRKAGLPPELPPPPEGLGPRPLSQRSVVFTVLLFVGCMAAGIMAHSSALVMGGTFGLVYLAAVKAKASK